jgi:hypothetical protein
VKALPLISSVSPIFKFDTVPGSIKKEIKY